MKTDEVERDLWIISSQLHKLAESFASLAAGLTKDRKFSSKSVMRKTPVGETIKLAEEAQPPLPFSGDWHEGINKGPG